MAAIPIQFPPNSYGTCVNGEVTKDAPEQTYTLEARGGQTMYISFVGGGAMIATVAVPGQSGIGPYPSGSVIPIPESGRCEIVVGANQRAEQWTGPFTMSVLIANPSKPI